MWVVQKTKKTKEYIFRARILIWPFYFNQDLCVMQAKAVESFKEVEICQKSIPIMYISISRQVKVQYKEFDGAIKSQNTSVSLQSRWGGEGKMVPIAQLIVIDQNPSLKKFILTPGWTSNRSSFHKSRNCMPRWVIVLATLSWL